MLGSEGHLSFKCYWNTSEADLPTRVLTPLALIADGGLRGRAASGFTQDRPWKICLQKWKVYLKLPVNISLKIRYKKYWK